MSVTAAVGGRPLFFAGSPVAGVVGVLGVGIDSGAGVAGPDGTSVTTGAAGVVLAGRPLFFCPSDGVGVLAAVLEEVDSFVS